MELQYLRVFYEVARRGSISAAAEALHVAQPSVSRSIQNLEHSLGKKVFLRKPRGVVLTEEGLDIFHRCHKIFQECEAIEKGVERTKLGLRLAASENLCIHVLPQAFVKLEQQFPSLSIDLTSGTAEEIIKAVLNGEVEAGYCYHPSKAPGLLSVTVASVEFWIVASKKIVGSKPTLKDLKKISFIGSFARQYTSPYAAISLLAEAGLHRVEARYQSNSQEAQVAMVEAGLGYSLVPWFLVKHQIKQGKLIRIPTAKKLKTALYRVTRVGLPWSHDLVDDELRKVLET